MSKKVLTSADMLFLMPYMGFKKEENNKNNKKTIKIIIKQ